MTISNVTQLYRIYPNIDSHYKGKTTTYVNIRVVERKNSSKSFDVPLYFENGVRVKIKPKSFENGIVKKGFYSAKETAEINERIAQVFEIVKQYVKQLEKEKERPNRGTN